MFAITYETIGFAISNMKKTGKHHLEPGPGPKTKPHPEEGFLL